MSEILYDILMWCQKDVKCLIQVKRYLENSSKRRMTTVLNLEIIEAISKIVSVIQSLEHPDSEYMNIILDTLIFTIRNSNNEFVRIESELRNLTLKILTCIEHMKNFHILFCKLLSFINLMCSHSINVWQVLARPVLNLFINKTFEHVFLEEALKEFNNISKNSKPSELLRIIKDNRDICQRFSMIAIGYGDILVQMIILEWLFSFTGKDRRLIKSVFCSGNQETSELLEKLDFSNFRKDSRIFLNAFNNSLGLGKKVFSLNCSAFYLGNSKLSPPTGVEGIWIDLNQGSKRISIWTMPNTRSTHSGILQMPVREVEGIKLDFNTLSEECCYSIIMKIRNTSDMCHFSKDSEIICKALISVNQRKAVVDFVKAIEELSDKIQWHQKIKTNDMSYSGDSLSQNSKTEQVKSPPWKLTSHKVKVSISSPLIFVAKGIKESKQQRSLSQTSCASSVLSVKKDCNAKEKFDDNLKTKVGRNHSQEKTYIGKKPSQDPNLQGNQISNRISESQILSLDTGFNSSLSSRVSNKTENIYNKWTVSDNNQLDVFGSEKTINRKLSPHNQHLRGNSSSYTNIKVDSNSNSEKDEKKGQIKRNYSRRLYEEWATSLDSSVPMEDVRKEESNKENHINTKSLIGKTSLSVTSKKKSVNKPSQLQLEQQNKKLKPKKGAKAEIIHTTSLLDPNGYSYKRWQLHTTSKRSNFWLNKLKETKNKASKPLKDIFSFTEEEDDSDDTNVFIRKKKRKGKEIDFDINKMKTEFQKFDFSKKDGKVIKNNRKLAYSKYNFQHKTSVIREFKLCCKRTGRDEEQTLVRVPVAKAEKVGIKDEYTGKQDFPLEGLHGNSFAIPFTSREGGNIESNKKSVVESVNEDNTGRQEKKSKRKQYYKGENILFSTGKEKISKKTKIDSGIPITSDIKLREIEFQIWKTMSESFESIKKREEKEITKYNTIVEDAMNRLAEGEEEIQKRLIRFEKCMEYFDLGISLSKINEETENGVTNILEGLNTINRRGISRKMKDRLDEFLENVEEKLLSKVDYLTDKKFSDYKINLLESYLSNNTR